MPNCPFHGDPMPRVNSGTLIMGESWNRKRAYYEDYLCSKCKFKVRAFFQILDLGRKER